VLCKLLQGQGRSDSFSSDQMQWAPLDHSITGALYSNPELFKFNSTSVENTPERNVYFLFRRV